MTTFKTMKVKIQAMFKNIVKHLTTQKEIQPLVIEFGEMLTMLGKILQDPKKAEAVARFMSDNKKLFTETSNAISSMACSALDIIETMDKLSLSKSSLNTSHLKAGFTNLDGLALAVKGKKFQKKFKKLFS